MKFKILKENLSSTYHVYHGTNSKFDEFLHQFIGNHGISRGCGFYFTDNFDVAASYGKILIECDIIIHNTFNPDKITINKDQVTTFIKNYIDVDGQGFLSNYGDVTHLGYDSLVKKCVDNLFNYSIGDIDIIDNLLYHNTLNSFNLMKAYDAIYEVFGKDGLIYEKDKYTNHNIYIIYSNKQIINKKRIIVEEN